jgi:hypothetical protein
MARRAMSAYMLRRLCEIDREIVCRAPEGSNSTLAQRFGVSVHCVEKRRRGTHGCPPS